MNNYKILIGSLLHDRGEITNCFKRHLRALDTSGLDVSYCFIIDGRFHYASSLLAPEVKASWVIVNDDGPFYTRTSPESEEEKENRRDFARLAFLRNILRERALFEEVDALFSVDSDILVKPDTLQKLVAAWEGSGIDLIAAVVDNSAKLNGKSDPEPYRVRGLPLPEHNPAHNVFNLETESGIILARHRPPQFVLDLQKGGYCDAGGAVCLYSADVLAEIPWEAHPKGEDIGFSLAALNRDYSFDYIPELLEHLMSEARLLAHKETCSLCREATT